MDITALYLVATPIGNLSDISKRCIETLKSVDFIACEDTRNTSKLLNHLKINKPLISYFEHNKRQRGQEILKHIKDGKTCALVTDAGMPGISDPGEDLVKLMYENGYKVSVIPGPCAFISALVISGMDSSRFVFEGFLSTNKKNRQEALRRLKDYTQTVILYEAPHKLKATLQDILQVFGNRQIALVREITKIYEQGQRSSIKEMIDYFSDKTPRGEYVLIIEGNNQPDDGEHFWDKLDVKAHVDYYISCGFDKKQAIKQAAQDRKIPKSTIYNIVMKK